MEPLEAHYAKQIKNLRLERDRLQTDVGQLLITRQALSQAIQDCLKIESDNLNTYIRNPTPDNKQALTDARQAVTDAQTECSDFENDKSCIQSDLDKIVANEQATLNKLISFRKLEAEDSLKIECENLKSRIEKDFPRYLAIKAELNGFILGRVEMERFFVTSLPDVRVDAGRVLNEIREELKRVE